MRLPDAKDDSGIIIHTNSNININISLVLVWESERVSRDEVSCGSQTQKMILVLLLSILFEALGLQEKSFCESYLNQINIRSFESIALPIPCQDRFLKCGPRTRNRSFFVKIGPPIPYLVLDLILGASKATFGAILVPQRPPGRPTKAPNGAKMLPNGGSKRIEITKATFSGNTRFSNVF